MEAHTSANEQLLVDGLSFKLKPGANYVINRRSVSYHPQGSNIYKTQSGTKVLKIVLNSNDWLDPSTVRPMFDLKNVDSDSAKSVRPVSGAWSFWRRLRIMCGGTLIEDFDYNRTHELYCALKPKEEKVNDDIEGFGYSWDTVESYDTTTMPGVASGEAMPVSMKILSGILNQPKYLPLRYMTGGLSFEFELVSDASDPVILPTTGTGSGNAFSPTNCSNLWEIENCQIKADVLTLDNSLENSYSEHILSGKSLPINFNTFITSQQTVSGQNISVSVSRAVSRLKGLFLTFFHDTHDGFEDVYKPFNYFYHPMDSVSTGSNDYTNGCNLEYQISLGSKLYPEYPVRSLNEAFAQLRKTVGLNYGHHALAITPQKYRKDRFIIGVDMEKISEMGFTGENTMNGQLLVIKVNALNKSVLTHAKMPEQMNIYLNSDQIMEVKDIGVSVFD